MRKRYLVLIHAHSEQNEETFDRLEADRVHVADQPSTIEVQLFDAAGVLIETIRALKKNVPIDPLPANPCFYIIVHDREAMDTKLYPHDF